MYTVMAFPENHTVHEVETLGEAVELAANMAEDYMAAYVLDENDNMLYQAERSYEWLP